MIRRAWVLIAASLVAGCMQMQSRPSYVVENFQSDAAGSTGLVLASSASLAYYPAVLMGRANRPIVIHNDPGGELIRYALWTKKVDENGEAIRFRGRCDSACTLFLSLPAERLCVYPGASFGFHRPYGASAHVNGVATQYMRRIYPIWVNEWIDAEGGLTSNIKRMSFNYASKYVPTCPNRR